MPALPPEFSPLGPGVGPHIVLLSMIRAASRKIIGSGLFSILRTDPTSPLYFDVTTGEVEQTTYLNDGRRNRYVLLAEFGLHLRSPTSLQRARQFFILGYWSEGRNRTSVSVHLDLCLINASP